MAALTSTQTHILSKPVRSPDQSSLLSRHQRSLLLLMTTLDSSNTLVPYRRPSAAGDNRLGWTKLGVTGDVPSKRDGQATALVGTTVYMFGGQKESDWLNDMHSFST